MRLGRAARSAEDVVQKALDKRGLVVLIAFLEPCAQVGYHAVRVPPEPRRKRVADAVAGRLSRCVENFEGGSRSLCGPGVPYAQCRPKASAHAPSVSPSPTAPATPSHTYGRADFLWCSEGGDAPGPPEDTARASGCRIHLMDHPRRRVPGTPSTQASGKRPCGRTACR